MGGKRVIIPRGSGGEDVLLHRLKHNAVIGMPTLCRRAHTGTLATSLQTSHLASGHILVSTFVSTFVSNEDKEKCKGEGFSSSQIICEAFAVLCNRVFFLHGDEIWLRYRYSSSCANLW